LLDTSVRSKLTLVCTVVKTMSRQDWKNKGEGWVRTQIDKLSSEAILTLINDLGLRPKELTGNGAGGWKGRTSLKKAQVVDASVSQLFAANNLEERTPSLR